VVADPKVCRPTARASTSLVERGRRRYRQRAFAVFCGQGLFDPPLQPGLGAGGGVHFEANCLPDRGDEAFIGPAGCGMTGGGWVANRWNANARAGR
jgi:hypothetical protein